MNSLRGTKLTEETIGTLFSVSRTIVRAAFNRLHWQSLVEFRQNRGAFVACTTIEEAKHVIEARIAIEREIFSKLTALISEKQVATLELIERVHQTRRTGDHEMTTLLSNEFHLLASRMAGNGVLAGFLNSLISRTSLILAQHATCQEADRGIDERATLLRALRERAPQAAAETIVDHLRQLFERAKLGQTKRAHRSLCDVLVRYA